MNTLLKNFINQLLALKSAKEMEDFLKSILTPQELEAIPKRLEIVRLLKKGVSQRLIAEKLKTGIATVTRGSKELQMKHFKNIS
ncbi:MAG: Trp family transcriptional regulator [Candidatus Gracilibacteria bacterium]|nr:Trp family transcriptional regulator [Candidatus Gracilibacteria bacterium]